LSALPDVLAVQSLRQIAARIERARELRKPIIWGMGGHVIKTGVAPVLIDLLRRGLITALAMNGSCLVHDFEIAVQGGTSEDVDLALGSGSFAGQSATTVGGSAFGRGQSLTLGGQNLNAAVGRNSVATQQVLTLGGAAFGRGQSATFGGQNLNAATGRGALADQQVVTIGGSASRR
jgi:hypothetical protein